MISSQTIPQRYSRPYSRVGWTTLLLPLEGSRGLLISSLCSAGDSSREILFFDFASLPRNLATRPLAQPLY